MSKLYICINKTPLNGYIHIDPFPKGDVPAFKGSLNDLNKIVEKAECEEILAPELLDLLFENNFDTVLKEMSSLLRHNGKFIIGGIEINELCRLVFLGAVSEQEFNHIMFEGKIRKNGIYPLERVKQKLTELGLEIEKVEIDGYKLLITAIRP